MGLFTHSIPSYSSICSNSATIDQWAVLANLLIDVTEARTHNRIYTPSHLWKGGVPDMSDNNNKNTNSVAEIAVCKGKECEEKSKLIYAFQSRMNVLKS